ncbi:response regulator, partial [Suilimivivens sp.]
MWKVMIVDDEKLICRLVKALVKWDELGMESVATADNALEALELLEEVRPDILITDIRMPGMDGLELIREVKKHCPEIEIIIISGYAHFEYAKNAIALGVGNYILKPINQEELNKTLLKIGERLKEKKYVRKLETVNRQATDGNKNRLRKTLLEDLISGHGSFSVEQLTKS